LSYIWDTVEMCSSLNYKVEICYFKIELDIKENGHF